MDSRNPEIKLTFDEVELCKSPKQLRHTAPYVWIVMLAGRDGCCVEADYYSRDEAPAKLKELLDEMSEIDNIKWLFQATDCRLSGIEGDEAVDAISAAISRYFETGNAVDRTSDIEIRRDVDFVVRTAFSDGVSRFTLHKDHSLSFC